MPEGNGTNYQTSSALECFEICWQIDARARSRLGITSTD